MRLSAETGLRPPSSTLIRTIDSGKELFGQRMGQNQQKSPDSETLNPFSEPQLLHIFRLMDDAFGDLGWWPAQTREEVVIGAILVQSVAWSNTVKAIQCLRQSGLLQFQALLHASLQQIETCVVPTRYYKVKAKKLKAFAQHLHEYHQGSLEAMLTQPLPMLREELLSVYGIGPETADDILLYAAELPSFVVDAYTKRIFHRIGLTPEDVPYQTLRTWFMQRLPNDTALFNQYHALLDAVGHHYCGNKKPNCLECPLTSICAYADAHTERMS